MNQNYLFGHKVVTTVLTYHRQVAQQLIVCDPKLGLTYQQRYQLPYQLWSTSQFKQQFGLANHQFIALVVSAFPFYTWKRFQAERWQPTRPNQLWLMLDHLQDSHNFGAIIRTAAACQVEAIVIANARQITINATVAKAAMGTIYDVPIIKVANLHQIVQQLKQHQFWVVATGLSTLPTNWTKLDLTKTNLLLIVGSEATGISQRLQQISDYHWRLPMANHVESLNVSVATGVALYELRRFQAFWNS